jgi:[acyl-carrier-protein] S-malonyltransferase
LFPGQGAHQLGIIESLRQLPAGPGLLEIASDVADLDLASHILEQGEAALRQNEIVALVTAAHGLAACQLLTGSGITMDACAGYSVGQWTAMAAAGMVSPQDLMQIIWRRSQCMNAVPRAEEGAMLAVIGLANDAVAAVCQRVSTQQDRVDISNFNCIGQLTISGHRKAVDAARTELQALGARKLVDLNVSGAWHCPMMTPACTPFEKQLGSFVLKTPRVPVADNVTGGFLPEAGTALTASLVQHLDHPVLWEAGIKALAGMGIERSIEVGYGNVLTKIGFFIDRSRKHVTYDSVLQLPKTQQ